MNDKFLYQNTLTNLEKMIRLHNVLQVNLKGINVDFNVLKKVDSLQ